MPRLEATPPPVLRSSGPPGPTSWALRCAQAPQSQARAAVGWGPVRTSSATGTRRAALRSSTMATPSRQGFRIYRIGINQPTNRNSGTTNERTLAPHHLQRRSHQRERPPRPVRSRDLGNRRACRPGWQRLDLDDQRRVRCTGSPERQPLRGRRRTVPSRRQLRGERECHVLDRGTPRRRLGRPRRHRRFGHRPDRLGRLVLHRCIHDRRR